MNLFIPTTPVMLAAFVALSIPMAQSSAEEVPVSFPALDHYAKLWERSLFTTREMPPVDATAGPNFTDELSLTGIYEVDGTVVAVIVDRSTSQIIEARIGSDNEAGMRIRKVNPGSTIEKTRIQLQKGDQAGWITFTETPSMPAEPAAPNPALATRAAPRKAGAPAGLTPPSPAPVVPNPGPGPYSPLLPPPPPQSVPNDVPLPPP